MKQWVNVLRNNSFVNPTLLSVLCRNFGAIHLAQLGLIAGWLADEMWVNNEYLKFIIDQMFKIFATFNKVTVFLEQYECV